MNEIDTEYEFVMLLNNKKIKELDLNTQELIYSIFDNVNDKEIIKAWKNHLKQKTDIMIKIGKTIKGISLKKGSRNSVHVEPLSTFVKYLRENEIPESIIKKYVQYHYADGTIKGNGMKRMSSYEYKYNNMNDIELINKYFNESKLIKKSIERFVLKGTNSMYEIDALCMGEANDYLWITKKQIKEILENNTNLESTGPHISSLFVQPQTRNLNYNRLYESKRHCVQIKWYSLFDDIIKYKYEKHLNQAANDGFD
jgi:hypothetical protein